MWSGCVGQVQLDNNNSESSESIGILAKGEVGEETLWNTPAEGDTDLAVAFQKNSAEHSRPPSPIIFHWWTRPEVPPLTLKLFSAHLPRITIRCFFLYVVFISVLISVPFLIPLPALHGTSNIFVLPALEWVLYLTNKQIEQSNSEKMEHFIGLRLWSLCTRDIQLVLNKNPWLFQECQLKDAKHTLHVFHCYHSLENQSNICQLQNVLVAILN